MLFKHIFQVLRIKSSFATFSVRGKTNAMKNPVFILLVMLISSLSHSQTKGLEKYQERDYYSRHVKNTFYYSVCPEENACKLDTTYYFTTTIKEMKQLLDEVNRLLSENGQNTEVDVDGNLFNSDEILKKCEGKCVYSFSFWLGEDYENSHLLNIFICKGKGRNFAQLTIY